MNRKKVMTASDLMAKLQKDPEFTEKRRDKDLDITNSAKILASAEKTIVQRLNSLGLNITSVWDLVNSNKSYSFAIDLLVDELQQEYPERIKEAIVRALAVPEAAGIATKPLIDLFAQSAGVSDHLRWVIGLALIPNLTLDCVDNVVDLLKNPAYGDARSMLPFALVRFKKQRPDVETLLHSLKDDRTIKGHVEKALKGQSPF